MWRFALAAIAALLVWPAASPPATAAPFCLQQATGVPPQCLYHDVTVCKNDARRAKGLCALNPNELMPPTVGQRFCEVTNGPVIRCLYPERRSCDTAAARSGGICIDGGDTNSRPDPDLIPR